MQDEFTNRLAMFNAAKETLFVPAHKAVWFDKKPEIFALKVARAMQALDELTLFCRQQSSVISGVTQDKTREEREAIEVAFTLAGLLVEYYRDNNDETNAAKVDMPLSALRRLRDLEAVNKLREVHDLGKSLVENSDPAIVTAAAQYDITTERLTSVHEEVEEFAEIVAAPQASISQRAALTKQLRDRFNAVEAKFASLDNLILAFNNTPEGRALIAAYQASRIVRDSGGSPGTPNTNTPNTPPNP